MKVQLPVAWRRPSALVAGALAFGALNLAAGDADAQDGSVCVVCQEPAAVYRCRIGVEDRLAGGERALHFACITEIARARGHASCRVRRDLVGGCDGPEQVITWNSAAGSGVPTLSVSPDVSSSATAKGPVELGQPPPKAPQGPPQTLEEMARRTAEASNEQLRKAGSTVSNSARSAGEALQKTWTCVVSLFQRCGEQPSP